MTACTRCNGPLDFASFQNCAACRVILYQIDERRGASLVVTEEDRRDTVAGRLLAEVFK